MPSSRLPVPRTSTKRVPPDFSTNDGASTPYATDSPSMQKAARVHTRSPARPSLVAPLPPLLLPLKEVTPASARLRMSLAPSTKSPLATPPRRADRPHRLSVYGVPLAMAAAGGGGNLQSTSSNGEKRITVCARKRPLSRTEGPSSSLKSSSSLPSSHDCIMVEEETNQMRISVERTKLDGLGKYAEAFQFSFDRVFDVTASNYLIYRQIVQPLISFVAGGGRATCFAYGQTGSGKSHTMFRPTDGICFLGAAELVEGRMAAGHFECCLVSFFEIYQGHLYDLLQSRRRVMPCEKGDGQVKIMGLSEIRVRDRTEVHDAIQQGLAARVTGKTGANMQSSRSHAILQLTLVPFGGGDKDGGFARMSFIDLAGSERGADRAEVDRKTKLEGSEINKSLLALKECIRAIDMDAAHLPFRQSKLTLVLKDSFIGDVRTAMIATVSPAAHSSEHTLNTLRYAERFYEISMGGGGGGGVGGEGGLAEGRRRRMSGEGSENCEDGLNVDWTVSPLGVNRDAERKNPSHTFTAMTPVRTVTFGTPGGGREQAEAEAEEGGRKEAVLRVLGRIRGQVEKCHDAVVLELLEEELRTLSQAFESLC